MAFTCQVINRYQQFLGQQQQQVEVEEGSVTETMTKIATTTTPVGKRWK
jgi:hypothetical protein